MKPKKKYDAPRLFEYRIKYNAGAEHSELDSYHYYTAENASQALDYHNVMMQKHGFDCQTVSIERKNPFSLRWEDESEVLNQEV
ncbi:MAG: hypothetical protein EBY39_11070 [Flavobacteriia bacterium]|nr:hypothetical protein [Flavobacteriia bacterium]